MPVGLVRALAERAAQHEPLLELLGRLHVVHEATTCCVSTGEARLLAFLALRAGEDDRRHVAGSLWPDVDEVRAAGNLRTTLWRLNALPMPLVTVDRSTVALRPEVLVDVRLLCEWAARAISGELHAEDYAHTPWDVGRLDLLPGWQDDWLVLERERIRQRLLHALECMAGALIGQGRHPEAVEVALIAVSADPLRESAQRLLIEAHLAEGNWGEARRCFTEHCGLLDRELGVRPSPRLVALLDRAVAFHPGASLA